MTLRQTLGGDVKRVHEQLDRMLDREDGLVVLFDGERAVSYISGFGLSPCQLEMVALEIERVVRAAGVEGIGRGKRRYRRERVSDAGAKGIRNWMGQHARKRHASEERLVRPG